MGPKCALIDIPWPSRLARKRYCRQQCVSGHTPSMVGGVLLQYDQCECKGGHTTDWAKVCNRPIWVREYAPHCCQRRLKGGQTPGVRANNKAARVGVYCCTVKSGWEGGMSWPSVGQQPARLGRGHTLLWLGHNDVGIIVALEPSTTVENVVLFR